MDFKAQYLEKAIIGRGNFGVAYLVTEKCSGENYVAKKISINSLNEYEAKSCKLESRILESLDHPNIVHYKGAFIESGTLTIVMEYCAGGDLNQLIKSHKLSYSYFPESQITEWMSQLLSALEYLDSRRVIHRDIKSSNVYLTVDGKLKIGDFGIAKVLESTSDVAKTVVGTPYYMSPEVCENKPYTSKSDIWSLGCLFYEIAALKHPFTGNSFLALVMNILKETPPVIGKYSQDLENTIKIMLTKDMHARPSASELLKTSLFWNCQGKNNNPEEIEEYEFEEEDLEENDFHKKDDDQVEIGSKIEGFGLSVINPLELVHTGNFEPNESQVTDYNYSITIPTFTPDVEVSNHFFRFSEKSGENENSQQISPQKTSDNEYSDDFESVIFTQECESDQPYDDDFDEAIGATEDDAKKKHAINLLGKENFQKIYEYLKVHRKIKTPDEVVRTN